MTDDERELLLATAEIIRRLVINNSLIEWQGAGERLQAHFSERLAAVKAAKEDPRPVISQTGA